MVFYLYSTLVCPFANISLSAAHSSALSVKYLLTKRAHISLYTSYMVSQNADISNIKNVDQLLIKEKKAGESKTNVMSFHLIFLALNVQNQLFQEEFT